jgi:predicted nucleic acid-binding protein
MISAVLDACVLVPSVLADTLLRCAQDEHYRPLWSAEILDEVRRNLPRSVSATAADRRIQAMRRFFPEAQVDGYQEIVDQMTNHPKDRHVLAAAAVARADFIVTANLRDFPAHALDPHAIEALHPDDFLCDLLDSSPRRIVRILHQQADATGRHGHTKFTVEDVLDGLAGCNVTRFAHRAREAV